MPGPDLTGHRLGGFELREHLGAGAFASVWRARQLRLGRDVAVKVLDPVLARNADAARRFEREGRSAASLDHPNIVPVYEAGEEDGLVFLAMRLVDGETLQDRLDRLGVLSPTTTVDMLRPVAAALDHAHSRDLTHRDIKPSNILLDAETVWLADFGIAATTQEIGRYTVGSIGTAEYMAPEQAVQGDVDPRADLYALGCVAHHCLTGRPPFRGDDVIPVMMSHVNDPVPPTGDVALDRFLATALAKEPDDRFQSGADLVDALEGLVPGATGARSEAPTLESAPVEAVEDGPRRGRVALVAGIGIAVVVAVVAAIALSGGGSDPSDQAGAPAAVTEATLAPEGGGDDGAVSQADGDGGDDDPPPEAGEDPTPAGESTPPPAAPGGQAEVGTNLSLTSLNPHTHFTSAGYLSGFVYPVLVELDPDFTVQPSLAAALPELVSSDPLVVRWVLRDDAVWDDGSPITARDVEATHRYLTSGAENLVGTYFYEQIDTFTVVSDTEFTVSFAEPIGAWRLLFSTTHPVVPAAAYDAHLASGASPVDFLQRELGFSGGPFTVVGFDPLERVSLRRNDQWWGEPATLDRITLRRYLDADAQIDALRTGDVDVIYVALPTAGQAVEARTLRDGDGGVEVETGASDAQFELSFNLQRAPFDDVRVRRAFAHAIDRDVLVGALVQPVTGKAELPLDSLVHYPRQPQYTTPFGVYGDSDEAERLLDEAGWFAGTDGMRSREGEPLRVTIMYRNSSADLVNGQDQAITVRSQLRSMGIEVELDGLNVDDYDDRRRVGDYDLRLDFTVTNADPAGVLLRFGGGHCPPTVPGCDGDPIGFNFGAYRNDEVDALLEQAKVTADSDDRDALFQQVDALLADDVPALPLYEGRAFVAYVSDLTGVSVEAPRGGALASLDDWGYIAVLE